MKLRLIFDFLPKLQLLIDDITSSLIDDVDLSILQFEQYQPRYSILHEICQEAPTCGELLRAVFSKLLSLPISERTCSVCHTHWFNDVDEATIKAYEQATDDSNAASKWLSISEDRRGLIVKEGFERVPLELMCGHVYCAGCIKQSLDHYEPLSCLVRDAYESPECKLLKGARRCYRLGWQEKFDVDEFEGCMGSSPLLQEGEECQRKAIVRIRAKRKAEHVEEPPVTEGDDEELEVQFLFLGFSWQL